MSLYLIINIAIITFPLLFSFENKIKFYKKWPYLFLSMIIVGIPFIIWDIFATARGDWTFNRAHLLNLNIGGIPIEEISFFIAVPYAIIFLYETYQFFIPKLRWDMKYGLFHLPLSLSIFTAFIFSNKNYTLTLFLFLSFTFLLLATTKPSFLKQKYFIGFLLFTFIPFAIVNYILTSLPVVSYKQSAIWGIRISTIPVEDFFYSFTLITLYIYFYELSKEKLKRKTIKISRMN